MKKIAITFFIFCISASFSLISAQNTKPSELRVKKQQQQNEAKSKALIFGEADPDFDVDSVPAKWKNESAVILCQRMDYSYIRNNKTLSIDEIVRRKIKLLDKAAIEAFSEFYYLSFGKGTAVGIQIIKPNGDVVNVSTNDVVEVDSDIPYIFQSYYIKFLKYKKIAIPNLEIGDIIDYFYKTNSDDNDAIPFIFTLSSTYPIVSQKFNFKVDRGFFINLNSYNGAPEIVEGEAGKDSRGIVRGNIKTYQLVDSDREKLDNNLFEYRFRQYPFVKFQVTYKMNTTANSDEFIGETGKNKSSVSSEEIQKNISQIIKNLSTYTITYSNEIISYLKKNYNAETDPEKIANAAYYYFRYKFLHDYYNPQPAVTNSNFFKYNEVKTKEKEKIENIPEVTINNYQFCAILLDVFKKKKIEAEVLAVVPRSIGTIKDLLLARELNLGLRVNKDFYLLPFNNFSIPQSLDENIEGSEAVIFTVDKNPKDVNYENINLPITTCQQNKYYSDLAVTINEDFEQVKISRKNNIEGYFKNDYSQMLLIGKDYMKEDEKKYNPNYKDENKATGNIAKIAEEKRKREADKEELIKNRKDMMKKYTEKEFDLVSYDSLKIIEDGRYNKTPNLSFNEVFVVKNMINKAGKNYILNVGSLIGKQIELNEKEFKRNSDVYINFAKSLVNNITITLPAGFTVENINDLNVNIDNESGNFISTANLTGNMLTIKTTKSYKNNFEKKESWQNMVNFLEAAYKFSQKKIILKKV